MTKLTRFALVAGALLIGASSAIAAPGDRYNGSSRAVYSSSSNEADPYAGHNPNSPKGNRAYWDYQGRHGN